MVAFDVVKENLLANVTRVSWTTAGFCHMVLGKIIVFGATVSAAL